MTIFKLEGLVMARAITTLENELKRLGVSDIHISNEVAEFEVAVAQVGKTNLVGEHFRRELNTLPPSHVMCAGAYDETGSCICTVAAQYQDIKGRSLQRHLIDFFERTYASENGGLVVLKSESLAFVGLEEGPFIYVGEGFVRADLRGSNFLGILQRLLILSANMCWPNTQLTYGFMTKRMIDWNYHINWGYSTARRAGLMWQKAPQNTDWRSPYLVALSSEGLCRLAEDPLLGGLSRRSESSKKETGTRKSSGRVKLIVGSEA